MVIARGLWLTDRGAVSRNKQFGWQISRSALSDTIRFRGTGAARDGIHVTGHSE